ARLVLDPGHGGKDPGAIGRNGVLEKTITLDLGLRLANLLRGQEKIQVRLTRETDTFVPLQDRVKFARALGADLFVSIHADSAPNPKARGLSVYSLSDRASDDLTKSLVEQEIKAEPEQKTLPDYVDPEVAAILLDLTTKRTRQLSAGVKERIIRGMTGDWPILTNPIRSANFVVLRAPDVPSVLLESGFLSNTQDATMLAIAGLTRLGLEHKAASILDTQTMLPAVAQGAIGVEIRRDDDHARNLVTAINCAKSMSCVAAERALLKVLDGSCRTPIAALAQYRGADKVYIEGLVAKTDGSAIFRLQQEGPALAAQQLGEELGLAIKRMLPLDFFAA
ncbi:MAG: hypothetical protein EBV03_14275, partial [Proteobacteria bacterium]|nr:hypothetical protein [Pseudomonadota bacterium]